MAAKDHTSLRNRRSVSTTGMGSGLRNSSGLNGPPRTVGNAEGWVEDVAKTFSGLANHATDWLEEAEKRVFQDVQTKIDIITEKAQRRAKSEITFSEKMFLSVLYRAMVYGARHYKDWPEAARLLEHYLEKDASGKPVEIDSGIYEKSETVRREMTRQKKRFAAEMARYMKRGKVLGSFQDRSRTVFADSKRLKYADNRFVLTSQTTKILGGRAKTGRECETIWRVDNTYDFEDFKIGRKGWEKSSLFSEIPFRGKKVKIYDGLSKYLVELEMAVEFRYFTTWTEEWKF